MKRTLGSKPPTKFMQDVWQACKMIPKGRVSTYAEVAKMIRCPQASRAVGNALNRNPLSPKIPCHRIVKSNGELGGFARGKKEKIRLLKAECIRLKKGKFTGFKTIVFKA